MIGGLDIETITNLLKEEKVATSSTSEPTVAKFLKPIQVGPLAYKNNPSPCVSRGCTISTLITVNGITYCSSHALTELNRLLLDTQGFDYSDCNCNAGRHSKMNIHTSDCPVWHRVKEQQQVD